MNISFDPAKNTRNVTERQLPFTLVEQFNWATALIEEDTRKVYTERRFSAQGLINDRLHVVVFTPRAGNLHIISLRKANSREVRHYEKNLKP